MKCKLAFTLAEVLITLSILGIVAALTIPSVHRKWQDAYTVASVRRAYTILDTALQQMILIEGKPSTWEWPVQVNSSKEENTNYFMEKLSSYVSMTKKCGSAYGCTQSDISCDGVKRSPVEYQYYKDLKGNCSGTFRYADMKGMAILKNGMYIAVSISHPYYDKYPNANYNGAHTSLAHTGVIRIDTNGKKGPNRAGYDIFHFAFNEKGLKIDRPKNQYDDEYINPRACTTSATNIANGLSCGSWIIRNGNVDYKYRDVSSEW